MLLLLLPMMHQQRRRLSAVVAVWWVALPEMPWLVENDPAGDLSTRCGSRLSECIVGKKDVDFGTPVRLGDTGSINGPQPHPPFKGGSS